MTSYSDAGVHLELGDQASQMLYEASKKTWKNRAGRIGEIETEFDDFSGLRLTSIHQPVSLCIGFDTIGTKAEIAERTGDFKTLGFDLIAMVADDAVVRGGEPVLVGSNLEISTLGVSSKNYLDRIRDLAQGYEAAATEARVAILNGELAEIGNRVSGFGDFNLNWGACCVWFAEKKNLISGKNIQPHQTLIGLEETGFRCNGISLLRKVFRDAHGENWHQERLESRSLGEWALTPSRIYSRVIVDLLEDHRNEIHGISHITGGGLPGKMERMLRPSGFGAELSDPFTPGLPLLYCQKKGQVSDEEAYRTWNMGQGMVICTSAPEKILKELQKSGIPAKPIGKIRKEKGIQIRSQGSQSPGKALTF